MSPEALFGIVNPVALLGWIALLVSPLAPRIAQWVAALVIPGLLSVAYTVLILVNWADAEGGYDSLANVMLLFDNPAIALAGWIHYLAFDLFVGAWEVRVAAREKIAFYLVVPCLVLTFLFGPVGLALFFAIRAVLWLAYRREAEGS